MLEVEGATVNLGGSQEVAVLEAEQRELR